MKMAGSAPAISDCRQAKAGDQGWIGAYLPSCHWLMS
jgi:hypothetical protein